MIKWIKNLVSESKPSERRISHKAMEMRIHLARADAVLKEMSAGQPIFDGVLGIRGAPVRHVFMIAMIEKISALRMNYNQISPINILEIGSYVGSSLLTWDYALRKYNGSRGRLVAIDPLDSYVTGEATGNKPISRVSEIEEGVKYDFAYKIFKHNISFCQASEGVLHLRIPSNQALSILEKDFYDVVYVDGDHSYKHVKNDLCAVMPLIREGGVLCGDDLELQGFQCDLEHASSNSESDYLLDPFTNSYFHPGVTLAVHEVLGKVSSWDGFWAVQKLNGAWIPASLTNCSFEIPEHFGKELTDQLYSDRERLKGLMSMSETLAPPEGQRQESIECVEH